MTQPFADALTWVPKSRALGATLAQANDLARARSHGVVTLDHLLQALLEDGDAVQVLETCHIDIQLVGRDIAEHIKALPTSDQPIPVADPDLLRILEYAVAAAQQSRRREVNGAIVLAAIVGEGKSGAAALLLARGLTFQETVRALQRTASPQAPVGQNSVNPAANQSAVQESSTAKSTSDLPAAPPPTPVPSPPRPPRQANTAPLSDDDPVATARRRIAAARTGLPLPPLPRAHSPAPTSEAPASPPEPPRAAVDPSENSTSGHYDDQPQPYSRDELAAAAYDQSVAVSSNAGWAPPSVPVRPASSARPARLPPLMPPIATTPYDARPEFAPINGNAPDGYGHDQAANPAQPRQFNAPWEAPQSELPLRQAPSIGQSFDQDRLSESIPRRFRVGRATNIEIRIPRAALPSLAATANNRFDGSNEGQIVALAVSVRLKSLTRGFHVEAFGPETQWLDNRHDQMLDDDARWRWIVTPMRSGPAQFQVVTSFRSLDPQTAWTETMLPEQVVAVRISASYAQVGKRWAGWISAALVGAAVAVLFGQQIWNEAQILLTRLNGQ